MTKAGVSASGSSPCHGVPERSSSISARGTAPSSGGQHQKIADAIRNGDPKAAASAMRRHVQTVSKVRLLTWDPQTD
ncbi:FCD domain-containing protein [Amycolatopsis sp. cmx-11-12]|uniref:FCD domain-containing protein n=1 Tax=Amycolatopsis sp. cmx-11-12 TaxID=2785795 RepID=UPI00391845B3